MNKFWVSIILGAFVVLAVVSYYTIGEQSGNKQPSTYMMLSKALMSEPVHPGASKADVRALCKIILRNPSKFDRFILKGDGVEAEITIDGVKYQVEAKESLMTFDFTVTDGSEIFSVRDFSSDGTVDKIYRAEYSYLHFGFRPVLAPSVEEEGFTEWMDSANRDYAKYLVKLNKYFGVKNSK